MEAINHVGKCAGAIGFLLGNQEVEVLFTAKVVRGNYCILKPMEVNEPIVFGKGSTLPDIHQIIKNSFDTYSRHYGDGLYLIGTGIRAEILKILQSTDNGFADFGISPTMVISKLIKGGFVICGEERKGLQFVKDDCLFFKYRYKNNGSGQITIKDSIAKETFSLVNIDDLSEDIEGREFDPENLSKS